RLHGEERKQLKLMLEITDHRQGCGDIADTAVQSLRVHISRKMQRAGSIRPTTITNFQITSRGCYAILNPHPLPPLHCMAEGVKGLSLLTVIHTEKRWRNVVSQGKDRTP